MLENIKNIEIIVELLKKNDIKNIVISPGGTNIPFVRAVENDDFFTCYSVVDERSAVYFAIGIYLQTNKPVALCCTSAQATRNYIPGLTEAFYKCVPILAITMSKHPRFTYQEYMQAPDQTSLPKDSVKKSYALPYISDINDVYHSIRMVNDAICELSLNGNGPVQLCVPWLDFKINESIPEIRQIKRYTLNDEWSFDLKDKKLLIVIGEHRPFTEQEKEAINEFSRSNNVVIYTNHLSNFKNMFSLNANFMMSTIEFERFDKEFAPDVLITIGGQTGDYPLYKILSKKFTNSFEHWRVAQDGKIVDTYDKLTKVFKCNEDEFFNRLKGKHIVEHSYYNIWLMGCNNIRYNIKLPLSNAYVAQSLHNRIPQNSVMQFSILHSLRIWELFPLDPTIKCYSNVGAFGIDGGMSTLIGQSVVTNELCFMIIGDLAFYYDMNSIGIRHISNNLRILLINNNGGVEFKLSGKNNEEINRYIAAGNHFVNAEGWAKTCGFEYLSADNETSFEEASKVFLANADKPILFEVFVSDIDEAVAYKMLIETNKEKKAADSIKRGIKYILKKF